MSRCLSAPDATSLHHRLQNHCQYFTILSIIQELDTKRPVASLGKGDLLGICHLLSIQQVNGFSVTSFRTFSKTLTFIILVGGIGGRGGIKMASAKNNQLISSQGPHFSPRSTAKTNGKSTNLRKNGIYWYK